ncbi:MAG: sigma-54 interaction domain-containing protein [Suipraeoptans sp.]
MVKILVFVPRVDMLEQFQNLIKKYEKLPDVKIELTHVFGTPDSLSRNRDAEIFVARGMTYDRLKILFPKKHMIEIQMTSFAILDALIASKEKYKPKQIAVCLHNVEIQSMPNIEEVCSAKIDVYDVWNEESAERALAEAQQKGTDVFVGAGTICGLCDRQGLKRTHIKTSDDEIENALREAVNTAATINRERKSYNVFRTIINSTDDGLITINDKGIVEQINNQAYSFFHISAIDDVKGHSISLVNKSFKWKQAMQDNGSMEDILKVDNRHYLIQYKQIKTDERNTGLLIRIKNSENILKEEKRIRHSLSEKGLVAKYNFPDIIGNSKGIKESINMAKKFSQVDSNVLITGETGTGKELFAHSIHNASKRCNEPFVALNCAALTESLLESELFGYVGGAFSGASKNGKTGLFELAHKGTIFLDEIGEIPISLQAKLLRVLQEKEIRRVGGDSVQPIDVRVISATNINIDSQIEEGKFRADLYYRLNLLELQIRPLRERREDIQEMVDFYLNRFSVEMGKSPAKLTSEAAMILTDYSWPGNARELRNVCERLVVLGESNIITIDDLSQFKMFRDEKPIISQNQIQTKEGFAVKKKKEDLAKELGVSRTTLWRMMKQREENETKENEDK